MVLCSCSGYKITPISLSLKVGYLVFVICRCWQQAGGASHPTSVD